MNRDKWIVNAFSTQEYLEKTSEEKIGGGNKEQFKKP